ncbi:MAG: GNAT family N-acetyltransferase [Anaerolineales bacterium]|nr:GNAT family N-acetyltransferase [Anaerolineales bacterium]
MEFTIRHAAIGDAPELAVLLREIGFFQTLDDLTLEQVVVQVQAQLAWNFKDESHTVYVGASLDGQLLGYAAVHWLPYLFHPGREGYVSELFVSEAARGQGLGRALLEAVKEEARKKRCYRLSLMNNRTRESYQRKFYQKLGWEERSCMADFVFMLDE